MLILKPIAHETIWGGTRLLKYVDEKVLRIGHLYSVIDEANCASIITNGEYAGRTVTEWFSENKARFNLAHYDRFPVIIAIVDAAQSLSIQVHPDDAAAAALEGAAFGKNESWYFLEPPNDGWIYNGCTGDWLKESGVARLPISKNDYVYVEAGTVHSLTAGSYLYEIEENSPFTYRINDFERIDNNGSKRELHIAKAALAVKPEKQSTVKQYNGNKIRQRIYETETMIGRSKYINSSKSIECLTYVSGGCTGTSTILEPNESFDFTAEQMMLARIIS